MRSSDTSGEPDSKGGRPPGETHLVTELGNLELRSGGPALAGISLVTQGSEFPLAGWSDFVLVVMSWWLAAILRLLTNGGTERVHFMDGPYAVDLFREQSGQLQFRMLSNRGGYQEVGSGSADPRRFADDLLVQADKLLQTCKAREWWSPDAESLAALVRELGHKLASDRG